MYVSLRPSTRSYRMSASLQPNPREVRTTRSRAHHLVRHCNQCFLCCAGGELQSRFGCRALYIRGQRLSSAAFLAPPSPPWPHRLAARLFLCVACLACARTSLFFVLMWVAFRAAIGARKKALSPGRLAPLPATCFGKSSKETKMKKTCLQSQRNWQATRLIEGAHSEDNMYHRLISLGSIRLDVQCSRNSKTNWLANQASAPSRRFQRFPWLASWF